MAGHIAGMCDRPDTYLEQIKATCNKDKVDFIVPSMGSNHPINDEVPPELAPLCKGMAVFNFDSYGLPGEQLEQLRLALAHHGVRVPGTRYKLRVHHSLCLAIEPSSGDEPELPADWRRYLIAGASGHGPRFVGRQAAGLTEFDLSDYVESEDGWTPARSAEPVGV
jgi:hypothetical protein